MAISLPLSERNLILTGYTGPNQPLIGRQVAERLGMPLVSVETLIAERAGMSVEAIRRDYGARRLQTFESAVLEETVLRRSTVIRVGASTLLSGKTLERLRATGPVVCLVTTLDAVLQRLHVSMGARYANPAERAVELGVLRREWGVRGLQGVLEVDATYMSAEETTAAVVTLWQDIAIART